MQSRSLENIEIRGICLFILEMEIFSETITYVCCSVLRFRDRSGDREVAREIYSEVGQGSEPQKGSALKLRNVFIKKLGDLLCNVATLRKNEISVLCNVVTLVPNIETLATQF